MKGGGWIQKALNYFCTIQNPTFFSWLVVGQMEEGGTEDDFKVSGLSNSLSGYLIN